MKQSITIIVFFISYCINAQIFTGAGGPIVNNGLYNYFDISVSGLSSSNINASFGIEKLCINVSHPTDQQLNMYLKSPNGTMVELTLAGSADGANYVNTCFDSKTNTSVTLGSAPYTGNYKPIGYLGRFNTGQPGNGIWRLIIHDNNALSDSGNLIDWNIQFGNNPSPPVSFTSSNLPIVIINTNNQIISETEIMAHLDIIDNGPGSRNNITDNPNNYSGKIMIHIRGTSSKVFAKKPYSIETRDGAGAILDASILGMPAESDWVLIPSYSDKTLLRNPFTYSLFGQMGHYSPRYRFVEVILNNEYRGIYIVAEKPKRGKDRVDISKLTDQDNADPGITGGYLLKIDRTDEDGWYSLLPGNSATNAKFYYQYIYPKDTAITAQQKIYIKSFMDEFETVMNSSSFADPINGYSKYIDVPSFVDFFIITELCKNPDGYKLSTYLYKDKSTKGGKLHMGPVWDYDISWYNCNYGNAFSPSGWQYQIPDDVFPAPTWWERFLQDPNFINKINCRWKELRQGVLDINSMKTFVDQNANLIDEAQGRNFTQWPILGAYIYPNPQNQATANYQTELTYLKNWISDRIAWLDANIAGICSNIGISKNEFSKTPMAIFPNPFINTFNIEYTISEKSIVKLELLNIIGEQIFLVTNENKTKGIYKEFLNTERLADGIYIMKLTVNETVYYRKLTKVSAQ